MISKQQIIDTYKGRPFHDMNDDVITQIVFDGDIAILVSGSYDPYQAGYYVDAIIDRNTGSNLIPGRCRPCDDKDDAVDVAYEMLWDAGIR
jgi:hypothetical protein